MTNDGVQKREVKFYYNTWELKTTVNSVPEEVDLHIAAYLKDRCLGHGLQPMVFETGWAPARDTAHEFPCDDAVLKDFNHARQPRGTTTQQWHPTFVCFKTWFP